MHLQFTNFFVNIIYRFYDNNVIIIRKNYRVKKSLKMFVEYTSLLFLIVILKKIILFSNYSKFFINYYYCYYLFIFIIYIRAIFLFN